MSETHECCSERMKFGPTGKWVTNGLIRLVKMHLFLGSIRIDVHGGVG